MFADRPGEFETIARLLKPLTGGDPAARNLEDDAAVLPSRPGQDLVITKDAMVEGVHFLASDPIDLVARKLLRANLSDLAAKGAEPFGYLLAVAWPRTSGWPEREAFAAGLAQDQQIFGVHLLGGDTVVSEGPFSASITALGWAPHGRVPGRGGARPGDAILVSGPIGDGWLGLKAARGELPSLEDARVEALARHYQLPEPRVGLARAMRDHAAASIDVSDGLIADLGHIAAASGVAVELHLERIPLSAAAKAWLAQRTDPVLARADLAAGGDDYQLACAVRPEHVDALLRTAEREGAPLTIVGQAVAGEGVRAYFEGQRIVVDRAGWTHG